MSYAIQGLCPRTDIMMGAHAFQISLSPEWPKYVEAANMPADEVYAMVRGHSRMWLDACGYTAMFDPDNCGAYADEKLPPGPDARPLYDDSSIRISWGAWGPEHISVPGNACGLDIDDHSFGCLFNDGRTLVPHNIDCWKQKQLLLIVFCELAESILLLGRESPNA